MSNRIYKVIVIAQISLITLLLMFTLNAELVLEKVRNASPVSSNFSQDGSWEVVKHDQDSRQV